VDTVDIIDRICNANPDVTRAQALSFIDEACTMLTQTERASSFYLDSTTGDFPYFPTTDGTYVYSVNTTTFPVWKIAYILTDITNVTPTGSTSYFVSLYNLPLNIASDIQEVQLLNRRYLQVPVKCTEEKGSTAPTVTFLFNPGTETTRFRLCGHKLEAAITSETVQVPIPQRLISTCLIPAAMKLIDGVFNGRYEENVLYIENVIKPKVLWALNKDDSNLLNCLTTGKVY
jgi:hypothetical protein